MIKRILTYPNDSEILSQRSQEVSQEEDLSSLIQDLKDTLKSQVGGKGISAVQIGVLKRVCICSWDGKDLIMINPKITRVRGSQDYLEGCLSAPNIFLPVTRYQKVWCDYYDENWSKKTIAEGGRMSDIIQHELDHFEGVCKLIK